MGGRGASFSKFIGEGISNSNDIGTQTFINDEPIPEEEMTEPMKQLKENNIITYKSMLKLQPQMLELQINNLTNLVKQEKRSINLLNKDNPMSIQLATFSDKNVQACFSRRFNFNDLKILFNANIANKSIAQIEQLTKEQQDIGWWAKCDKQNLAKQTATHEFGHFIQYNAIKKVIDRRYKNKYQNLLNEYSQNRSKENFYNIEKLYVKIAHQINNKIALISKKKYGTMNIEDISQYGQKNQAEMFAELYANMSLSSKPADMAKALKLYLRGKDV